MCPSGHGWSSVNDFDGRLSFKEEVIPQSGQTKKVLTWRNIDGGAKDCQWFGLSSDSYAGKDFRFDAWINFIGSVPPQSTNFGLKVCGRFYSDWISKATADSWYHISEIIHCNGGDGNHILMLFDGVATNDQVIKMYDFTLREPGKQNVIQ